MFFSKPWTRTLDVFSSKILLLNAQVAAWLENTAFKNVTTPLFFSSRRRPPAEKTDTDFSNSQKEKQTHLRNKLLWTSVRKHLKKLLNFFTWRIFKTSTWHTCFTLEETPWKEGGLWGIRVGGKIMWAADNASRRTSGGTHQSRMRLVAAHQPDSWAASTTGN